tara:strand:- start:24212 stop:25417 length:1206 start_codon:yes stop_codon:yes gene_type:complete
MRVKIIKTQAVINYFKISRHSGHFPELDGLRGIAVLLVLLRHTSNPFFVDANFFQSEWHVFHFIRNGTVGVDLFFVLSGFLITSSILRLRDKGRNIYIPIYLAKRALRIIPAYYFVLFFVVAGGVPFYSLHTQYDMSLILRTFYHAIFMQDYMGNNIVVTFWSLGVEEKFYLLIPFVLMLLCKFKSNKVIYFGTSILILLGPLLRFLAHVAYPEMGYSQSYLSNLYMPLFYYPFHTCLDPLFIGVLCAFIYRSSGSVSWCKNEKIMNSLFWVSIALLFLLLTQSVMFSKITVFDKVWQRFIVSVCFGSVMLSLILGFGTIKIFQSKVLLFFAVISYSLYLVHMPLQPMLLETLEYLIKFSQLSITSKILIFYPTFFVLSIIIALVVYYVIEKPFLVLKDRF